MHFSGGAGDKSVDVAREGFRMASRERCILRQRIEDMGGVPDQRAARFMACGPFGPHVLYRLEAADRAAELLSLTSLHARLFNPGLPYAYAFGGKVPPAILAPPTPP